MNMAGRALPAPQSRDTISGGFVAVLLAIVIAMAAILYAMGRLPICACGTVKLWHGAVNSAENSQHIGDWYLFSHVIHGFIFFGLYWLAKTISGRAIPLGVGLIAAFLLEGAWEIAENTPAVIERYRTATVSLGYNGDSIINSIADMGWMTLGFVLAARLPMAVTIALALAMEIGVGWLIRDNLTLNVIMLLWPMDWIKAWQAGG
ncbi:MAG: DUF2585 domain-containing protein [Beijerinckiaceae bacterium]